MCKSTQSNISSRFKKQLLDQYEFISFIASCYISTLNPYSLKPLNLEYFP